jgi:glycosyltransferase involved in cell wall biosynthesis
MKPQLAICIPTYNRGYLLANCLQSIVESNINCEDSARNYEIIISDNCSNDDTNQVVEKYTSYLPIKYSRNHKNLGIARNFLNAISLASAEYAWLVGSDDLLIAGSIRKIMKLIEKNPDVDLFYINAFLLDKSYLDKYEHPFKIQHLPLSMETHNRVHTSSKKDFFNLIDPSVAFDYLGGMYLSVFRREKWLAHEDCLDKAAIHDSRTFSHFDNTFPHIKIFAHAFNKSKVYIEHTPLIVSLSGAREWAPMYPLVRSFRLLEALDIYKSKGLSWRKYIKCKNYSLQWFIPDLMLMIAHPKRTGLNYISIRKALANILFPNTYLSLIRVSFGKVVGYFHKCRI